MKIRSLITLIIAFVAITFLVSCKSDSTPQRQEMVDIGPVEQKEIVTYYIVNVDNLRAREGQLKASNVVAKLKEGTIVKYLNEKSELMETVTLRGKSYTEPYRKILIDELKVAWVYGGGLEVFHSGEDIDDIASINSFKSFIKSVSDMEITNGNAVLKQLMKFSSDHISTNDALYFLSKDYMDKLAYQGSLTLDKQGVTMSAEDYEAIVSRNYDMNASRIGKEADENGFVLTASEGMIGYETDQYALEGAIGGVFSDGVKEYIRLKKNEYKHRLFSDAAISGSMENLMNDAVAWSSFIERYPDFSKSKEVKRTNSYLQSALFNGTANTPAFDYQTRIATQEFRDLWNTTLETYPNAPFAKILFDHVNGLESNNWMFPES